MSENTLKPYTSAYAEKKISVSQVTAHGLVCECGGNMKGQRLWSCMRETDSYAKKP